MTALPEDTRAVSAEARHAARHLGLRPGAPDEVELLATSGKSTVLRVAWRHPRRWKVVLKRCGAAAAEVEATAHGEILPRVPVRAPELLGVWRDGGAAWLAIEDMGDEPPRLGDDRHRAMVSRWLGELHAGSRGLAGLPPLPDRGARHYAGRLERARARLAERRSAARSEDDKRRMIGAIRACDALRARWDAVEEGAARLPPTFVHSDIAPENLRVVRSRGKVGVAAIDWEKAGIGTPFVDLAMVDPAAYAAESGLPCETVSSSAWLAELLRALSHDWASKPIPKVERYGRHLERALDSIDGPRSGR